MFCGILWKEAFAGWGDESVADVGEYVRSTTFWRVKDETNTKFISRAFETQSYHNLRVEINSWVQVKIVRYVPTCIIY